MRILPIVKRAVLVWLHKCRPPGSSPREWLSHRLPPRSSLPSSCRSHWHALDSDEFVGLGLQGSTAACCVPRAPLLSVSKFGGSRSIRGARLWRIMVLLAHSWPREARHVGDHAVDGLGSSDERRLAFGLDPAQPVREVVVGRGWFRARRWRVLSEEHRRPPTASRTPHSLHRAAGQCGGASIGSRRRRRNSARVLAGYMRSKWLLQDQVQPGGRPSSSRKAVSVFSRVSRR